MLAFSADHQNSFRFGDFELDLSQEIGYQVLIADGDYDEEAIRVSFPNGA
jgi:hypothetical protein